MFVGLEISVVFQEEELQKQLDSALLGMRRELSTISKSLDMINSLANLRKARLHSLKSKGIRVFVNLISSEKENVYFAYRKCKYIF